MVSHVRFERTFFLVPNEVPLARLGEWEIGLLLTQNDESGAVIVVCQSEAPSVRYK